MQVYCEIREKLVNYEKDCCVCKEYDICQQRDMAGSARMFGLAFSMVISVIILLLVFFGREIFEFLI